MNETTNRSLPSKLPHHPPKPSTTCPQTIPNLSPNRPQPVTVPTHPERVPNPCPSRSQRTRLDDEKVLTRSLSRHSLEARLPSPTPSLELHSIRFITPRAPDLVSDLHCIARVLGEEFFLTFFGAVFVSFPALRALSLFVTRFISVAFGVSSSGARWFSILELNSAVFVCEKEGREEGARSREITGVGGVVQLGFELSE
jgi:hypothetical protein